MSGATTSTPASELSAGTEQKDPAQHSDAEKMMREKLKEVMPEKLKEANDILQLMRKQLEDGKSLTRDIVNDYQTNNLISASQVKVMLLGIFFTADGHVEDLPNEEISDFDNATLTECLSFIKAAIDKKVETVADRKYDLGYEAGKAETLKKVQTSMTDLLNETE